MVDNNPLPMTQVNFIEYAQASNSLLENKGWTYSYVYFLRELRDIYLVIRKEQGVSKKLLYDSIAEQVITEGQPWNARRILEQINALINFNLINSDKIIIKDVFNCSKLNDPLSNDDLKQFEDIFFSYGRFKDFIKLFMPYEYTAINNETKSSLSAKIEVVTNSNVVYAFFNGQKYFNNFLSNNNLFYIPDEYKHVMRFWEVFMKWGRTLELIEKVTIPIDLLPNCEEELLKRQKKNVVMSYFLTSNTCSKDVIYNCIENNFRTNYVFIPKLVSILAIENRVAVKDVVSSLMSFYLNDREKLSIERTSAIFIEKNAAPFFPVLNGSFVSHLLLK